VPSLLVCATLAAVAAPLLAHGASTPEQADGAPEKRDLPRETILLACSTVVLASVVKNLGYSFPTEDLSTGVNLELSRLFYGIGLVAAGVVGDKNRRYGELCCAAALVMPFLLLALQGASAPGTVLWAVDYLLYGFFSVFRVTLLADLAAEAGRPWMAGAGLMLGRVGDAAGTALCTALTWDGAFSIFAMLCSMLSIVSFWIGEPKVSRIMAFPIASCMLIYGVSNGSVAAVINEVLVMLSSVVGILKHDRKNQTAAP
jgi:hypothetical protein